MRSRFTTLRSRAKMLLKPRFGSRRCKGIWPPSKPLMRTPALAVCPFPPRPPVLPFPDPMPRPIRRRPWRAPALSEISLSFMACFLYGRPTTEDSYFSVISHLSSVVCSPITRTRCATLAIMPRAAGVSSISLTRPMRLSPRPMRVSRWSWRRRIGLPTCLIFMLLLLVAMANSANLRLGGGGFGIGVATARLQRGHLDVPPRRDRARRVLPLQGVESRPYHVVGIRGPDRFRHHVLHA